MRRLVFGILSLLLLGIEVLIGLFAHGWVRSYLGDVLVVILLYMIVRTIIPHKIKKWFVLPTIILLFSFIVEFLQLWGFCDRFGITNEFLRIIIGTGFSWVDIACYCIGIIPCYLSEYLIRNLLTKIKSLLAVFCFEITGHSKQTGVKSGLCFSINGFMLLGKPPSLVRSKCAGTCSGQLF